MAQKITAWTMGLLTLVLVLAVNTGQAQSQCPVIPLPLDARQQSDVFRYGAATTIVPAHDSLQPIARFLQQELLKKKHIPLKISNAAKGTVLRLSIRTTDPAVPEAYTLSMKPGAVIITGQSMAGLFYGVVSFLQLATQNNTTAIPCWNITDQPAYSWRGFMLDESRHFFGKAKVKQLLDQMAFYKLNRFHWHLTDEPGWRIEIKQYPALATVGGKGSYSDSLAPVSYYTQEDIKEIVAYAAARYITVIPEIDMPGHATAANRAYPEFSGGGSAKHPEFTFNPGKESTYQYLTNILKETDALFPSQMIHIGGDEVSFGNEKWMSNPDIQHLMANKGLKDAKAVEFYFIRRMADSLAAMDNLCLAWDEATQANLVPHRTIVFWWRHDQPRQLTTSLQKGYSVVLCPRLPFYFDFVQDSTHRVGRKWGAKKEFNALEKVYNFSLANYPIPAGQRSQVLGVQANLWTETIKTPERLDFMTYPRLAALAETAWTTPALKDFAGFTKRIQAFLPSWQQAGIHYFDPGQSQQSPEQVR